MLIDQYVHCVTFDRLFTAALSARVGLCHTLLG